VSVHAAEEGQDDGSLPALTRTPRPPAG
jgi:hypothetical protein